MEIDLDGLTDKIIDEINSNPETNTVMFDHREYTHKDWLFVKEGLRRVIEKTIIHIDNRVFSEQGFDIGILCTNRGQDDKNN